MWMGMGGFVREWLWLLVLGAALVAGDDSVYSCGGFIRSPGNLKVDLAQIVVRLYTGEGRLKEETDAAPSNGYYMIPVYAKGSYKLKVHPPPGWEFTPSEVKLEVDGVSDPCSKGEDINFLLAGFAVSGALRDAGTKSGPKGFKLSLVDAESGAEVGTAMTGEGGAYAFSGILPGSYELSVEGGKACVETSKASVLVRPGIQEPQADIFVRGYQLEGKVQGAPNSGPPPTLLLFSKAKVDIKCTAPKSVPAWVSKELSGWGSAVCATAAQDGHFSFACVPSGEYRVVALLEWKDGASWEIEPRILSAEVASQPASITRPFKVLGFTVHGSVVLPGPGSVPAKGAQVLLDGEVKATTDNDGRFQLKHMRQGAVEISARVSGFGFAPVRLELSASTPNLPPLKPSKLLVSGQVRMGMLPKGLQARDKRELRATLTDGSGEIKIQTDAEGNFAQLLEPGKWRLKPVVGEDEASAGVELVPAEKEIQLSHAPIKDLLFHQFQASVKGKLACLSGACPRVEISVSDGEGAFVASVSSDDSGAFLVPHLLPGQYSLSLKSNAGLCWAKTSESVRVAKSDVEGVTFSQTGFLLSLTASHPASLHWQLNKAEGEEKLAKGNNEICLAKSGTYTLRPGGCHKWNTGASFEWETGKRPAVRLEAVEHEQRGVIRSQDPIPDLKLHLKQMGSGLEQALEVRAGTGGASFSFYAERGASLSLRPSSSKFLFRPTSLDLTVPDHCQEGLEIQAYPGKFLKGRVKPGVAGVAVTMRQEGHSYSAMTEKDGSYSIGPLETLAGIEVEASKEGYVLTHQGQGQFSAYKLSELVLKTLSSDKSPLADVLVSVTGGAADFRANNRTPESGELKYLGLSPGDYRIRPALKEWRFEPHTKSLTIAEGSASEVVLVGSRVAWSAVGVVEHLGGEAVVGARVVATGGPQCDSLEEEATTGEDGTFRVRGLPPNCPFTLRLASHPDIADTIPSSFNLVVKDADVEGHRFLAAPAFKTMEVAGRVLTESAEWLRSCRVTLFSDAEPDSPLQSFQLGPAPNFYFLNIPLDGKGYEIRVESSLSRSTWSVGSPAATASFTADEELKLINIPFTPKRRRMEAEVGVGGWVLAALVLIASFAFSQRESLAPAILSFISQVKSGLRSGGVGVGGGQASPDSSPDFAGDSHRRHRPKSRKT